MYNKSNIFIGFFLAIVSKQSLHNACNIINANVEMNIFFYLHSELKIVIIIWSWSRQTKLG